MLLMAMAAGLVLVPQAMVDARTVRLGDLVRTADGGRLSERDGSTPVLRLPAERHRITLSAPALAALLRRQLPGREVAGDGTTIIALRRAPARVQAGCWASTRALHAGEPVTVRDVVPAGCAGSAPAKVVAAGADRAPAAAGELAAGAYLGRLLPVPAGRIASGTALALRSAVGPVVIERGVTTVQPGRSGRQVFVRDGEGHVFAALLALTGEAR